MNSNELLSIPISDQKASFRKQIRRELHMLTPEYCTASDTQIRHLLFSLPEYNHASRIFCFVGRKTEVDTLPILHHILSEGKQLAVPRCASPGIMFAHWITDPENDLFPGAWGILEPADSAPVAAPEEFDLILVPCCTCTHNGKRLGFGGGYYDRYLAQTSGCKIVLCRESLTKDDIPTDRYDLFMDIVLTDAGIWKTVVS